jgi:uncharacterized membrane protein
MTTSRVIRRWLSLTGFAFAVAFYCASLTPSLLPRSPLFQGVVSGLTAVLGYALGATLGALARRLPWRIPPRVERITWRVALVLGPVLILLFLALGTRWQQDLRVRLDMPRVETYDLLRLVGVSVLTFAVFLLIARAVRLGTRSLVRLLARWVPRPVAYAAGVLVVGYLLFGVVANSLWGNLVAVVSQTASLTNGQTADGVTAPTSFLRSGSDASAVAWDELGRQGRSFVATAPTVWDIERFTGRPGQEPIRVYAGLDSAPSARERAALAVHELERTGAFDRAVLGVVTATGTGWVDENVTASLEYMYGGDTALVSMQYSYLPSWLSFMVDQSKVSETAQALITAVHDRWSTMDPATRPKLVLFGESLGSYGTERTFDSLTGLSAGADGVLLVGPPFANPIWRGLVEDRAASTPVWDPVYGGDDVVRFSDTASDLRADSGAPKVVYLQNSSDPIVWWSPEMLVEAPEWLEHPRGPDISPDMRWYPGVTFWQTLMDLAFANNVPAGHGHVYGSGVAEGWSELIPPPGWTDTDTIRLRAALDATPR